MMVGSHPSPTALEANIKTFPSPPTERTNGDIEECVFGNFQNFREPRFKMSEPGFWVFSTLSGKGVNTQTDNLRVHIADSDTRTTSVGTTALSHNIVFICGDINALGWDPRMLFWENFRLWRPNRAFGVAGHGCPKVTGTTSIYYTLLKRVLGYVVLFTSLNKLSYNPGLERVCWAKRACLYFSSSNYTL